MVTLSNGKLKLIDLENSQQKTEDFLSDQLRSQTIEIEPDTPAHNQYLSMITDPEQQLAHFQYPPAIENVEVALLNVFESPEYLDNVAVADVIVFKVGMELGEIEKYRTTVEPFARGLSQAKLGQAWDQTSLLISMQGDLSQQHPQGRILVVSLQTENGQLGHSVAAGEKLLTNIVSALIHDVQPKNGGEREPYISRLLERYSVTATEFVDAIMERLEAAHALQVIESIELGKVGFLENIKKRRERDKIEKQLRKIIKTTENILDAAADGLAQDSVIAGVLKDEGLKKLFQPISLIPLVETLLINALVADAGEHYTPADIVQEMRDLGHYLLGSSESRQAKAMPIESSVVLPELLQDQSESPKLRVEAQKPELENRLFFPRSSKAEIGAEVIKRHYGEPSIKYQLDSMDVWPIEDSKTVLYEGNPLRLILRRDRNNRSCKLLTIDSVDTAVVVNGNQVLSLTDIRLQPGDVVSVFNTQSLQKSTFFYSASQKFELLVTNQTPEGKLHLVDQQFNETPDPFTIIGSIGSKSVRNSGGPAPSSYNPSDVYQANLTWLGLVRLTTTTTKTGEYVTTLVQLPTSGDNSFICVYPNGSRQPLHKSVGSIRMIHGMELIASGTMHLKALDSGLLVYFETQAEHQLGITKNQVPKESTPTKRITTAVGRALQGGIPKRKSEPAVQAQSITLEASEQEVIDSFIVQLQSNSLTNLQAIEQLFARNQELVLFSLLEYLGLRIQTDDVSGQVKMIGIQRDTSITIDGLPLDQKSPQPISFGSIVTLENKNKNCKLIFSVDTQGVARLLSVGYSNYLSTLKGVEAPYNVIGQVMQESNQRKLFWETIGVIRVFTEPGKQSPSMLLQLADKYLQHQIIRVDSSGERFQGIVTSGQLELGLGDWVQITIGKYTYALELLNSGYIVTHVIE